MILGFTGTRHGMTVGQFAAVDAALRDATLLRNPDGAVVRYFHHGDCVGADAEAHVLAIKYGLKVIIHPPLDDAHQAHCEPFYDILAPLTHLARNRAIVSACDVLIATPREMEHQSRGGTWYTHDYAKKLGKRVVLVLPDGHVRTTSGIRQPGAV